MKSKKDEWETMFVLRSKPARNGDEDINWHIPNMTMRNTAEVCGHLVAIIRTLEGLLYELWDIDDDIPKSLKIKSDYIG